MSIFLSEDNRLFSPAHVFQSVCHNGNGDLWHGHRGCMSSGWNEPAGHIFGSDHRPTVRRNERKNSQKGGATAINRQYNLSAEGKIPAIILDADIHRGEITDNNNAISNWQLLRNKQHLHINICIDKHRMPSISTTTDTAYFAEPFRSRTSEAR